MMIITINNHNNHYNLELPKIGEQACAMFEDTEKVTKRYTVRSQKVPKSEIKKSEVENTQSEVENTHLISHVLMIRER